MLTVLLSIAPIFVLVILGHALRRGGIPSIEFWNLNDRLVYWVLVPALLFSNISSMPLTAGLIGNYAIAILGGFSAAFLFGLLMNRFSESPEVGSSILQGVARHNTFIALAVAERLYGSDALALAALGSALLIPATNLAIVPALAIMLRKSDGRGLFMAIARELARNPLLLAVGSGLLVNYFGWKEIPVLHDVARLLGAAALPIVLLCVGANIHVRQMAAAAKPILLSIVGKLLVFPLVIFVLARWIGLSETETMVAVLFGLVPTAPSGFTLARQMGGDAPLMAAIITIQTLLSLISMPVAVTLIAARFA